VSDEVVMHDAEQTIRSLLGLSETDGLQLCASLQPPAPAVGEGFSAAPAEADAAVSSQVSWTTLPDWGSPLPAGPWPGELRRHNLSPGELLADLPQETALVQGRCEPYEPEADEEPLFVIDSRHEPVTLLALGNPSVVLHVERGRIEVWQFERAAVFSPPAVPAAQPTSLPAPDVELALADPAVEEWLSERVRALATSESSFERAAAVGLLLRLLAASTVDVVAWARDWAAGAEPDVVHAAEEEACEAGSSLAGDFDHLRTLLVDEPAEAGSYAADLVARRDDLQSAWRALRIASGGAALGTVLVIADEQARVHLTEIAEALASTDLPTSDWLGAVAWQEPESWWGALQDAPL